MIYMRNITITTAKSATYLENVGTDLIEPLSLDEAYLVVTGNKQNIPIATDIATKIRARIKEVSGHLAKMASDFNKRRSAHILPGCVFLLQPMHDAARVVRGKDPVRHPAGGLLNRHG